METLFIYAIKSSGLIAMFYFAYIILLRKETFFNSNRWFLLAGLITSVVLPLVVFTKIVWVDPSPTNIDWSKIPVTTPTENDAFEINWYIVFGIVYSIGILVLLMKFAFDFYSLSKILKGKTIQRQADFKFINVAENVSPFSYFNYIVYNSSLYSDMELENILEHEKVHSAQNHTVDVLISRLFCVVFWFNPLTWLYKNAIAQNLEFIADSEASKKILDKKAYQLTLLKITTQENCVAITNHFYQSLIKKRIVMLNKNQSNKRNYWKYALVFPLLGAFIFFFQVKVVAQEKKLEKQEITNTAEPVYILIKKRTSDKEIKEYSNLLEPKFDVKLKFSKIKRNSDGEITTIKAEFTHKDGRTGATEIGGNKPIKTFYFYINGNKMGFEELEASKYNGNVTASKSPLPATPPQTKPVKNSTKTAVPTPPLPPPPPTTARPTKKNKKTSNSTSSLLPPPPPPPTSIKMIQKDKMVSENPIIFINGKRTEATLADLSDVDNNLIQSMNVLKGKKAVDKYGKDGENGAIEISTKENVDLLKSPSTKAKNAATQDKSEIESNNKETIASKEEWLKTYKVIWKARLNLEKMKIEKEQAKVELEKARVAF